MAEDWESISNSFEAQNYSEALASMQKIQTPSTALYYNLALLHYKLQQLPLSLAYAEAALKRSSSETPHASHRIIQELHQEVHSQLEQTMKRSEWDPTTGLLEEMMDRFSFDQMKALLGLTWLASSLLGLFFFQRHKDTRKLFKNPIWMSSLALAAALGLLVGTHHGVSTGEKAAALRTVSVKSGPGEQFMQLSELPPGVRVRLLGPRQREWRQVQFAPDGIGWLPEADLFIL